MAAQYKRNILKLQNLLFTTEVICVTFINE